MQYSFSATSTRVHIIIMPHRTDGLSAIRAIDYLFYKVITLSFADISSAIIAFAVNDAPSLGAGIGPGT